MLHQNNLTDHKAPALYTRAKAALTSTSGAVLFFLLLISLLWAIRVAAQTGGVFFRIGKGYTDGVPRQVVRTDQDRVYIFSPNAQHTSIINVFRTTGTGLPTGTASFTGPITLTLAGGALPLSVDAVYDGESTIHVLINTRNGLVNDYPFDTTTNSFRPVIPLATDGASFSGNYIGSVGVSGMVATNGVLHMTYWSNANHIIYRAYTYNAGMNMLTASGSAFPVDTAGSANHPSLAISPLDGSITVAWISETATKQVLARTRSAGGTWGAVETVSPANVVPWTSRNEGVNIDQGPNMLITPNGARHLLYIENWDETNHYGRVHYASRPGTTSSWLDAELNFYSHNPGLATNAAGDIYLIGHGAVHDNLNMNMYTMKKNSNGSWGAPQLFAAASSSPGANFDSSPSIKWSVVGFNRPETVEFVFFTPIGGNYNDTDIWYGRFNIGGGSPPINTPNPTASPVTPTSLPNAMATTQFSATKTVRISWDNVTWAQGYQLQIDDDPNFGSPIPPPAVPDEFPTDVLSFTTPPLSNGVWYWRVCARRDATTCGNWSSTARFVVSAP